MADKTIADFTQITTLSKNDVALVSAGGTTFKATVEQFRGTIDEYPSKQLPPSNDDTLLISSGGVTLKTTVEQIRENVPEHNTTIGPMPAGCFGFITSGGTELFLYFPFGYYTKSNINILQVGSVTQCNIAVRHVAGGYILGSNTANALEYLTVCNLLSEGRGIEMRFVKSDGFGVTNNTPVSGLAQITITF